MNHTFIRFLLIFAYKVLASQTKVLLFRSKIVHNVLLSGLLVCRRLCVEDTARISHGFLYLILILKDVIYLQRASFLEICEPTRIKQAIASKWPLLFALILFM